MKYNARFPGHMAVFLFFCVSAFVRILPLCECNCMQQSVQGS